MSNQISIEGVTLEQTGPSSVTLTTANGAYHLTDIQYADWVLNCNATEYPGLPITLQIYSASLIVSADGFELENLSLSSDDLASLEKFLTTASFPPPTS